MAATVTVRVSPETRERLNRLSRQRNTTTAALLDDLTTQAEEHELLNDLNAAFTALHQDAAAWNEHLTETAAWDGTLGDLTA
ncbi:MAG: CopG family transcriptional regulator [Patulibacter sp.]